VVKNYFGSIPIYEEREAKVLGSSSVWSILHVLRSHGSDGCTAEEISTTMDLPISTVYNILTNLRAVGYVHTKRISKRIGRPNQASKDQEARTANQKRIYIEDVPWGSFAFTPEFANFLNDEIDHLIHKSEVMKVGATVIDEIITKMKNNPKCTDFLPAGEECPICHALHDANEYVMALVSAIGHNILQSDELGKILKKHGFN
jgi:DNA-binding transcriptional ArsR family regulator